MDIYSVSEVTKYIKYAMEADPNLRAVFVRGEISNFKRHYSGHCYFTLKDAGAAIKCVMFRSRAQNVRFEPKDGMKIVAGGAITVFERDGQYQLYAERLLPEGVGELQLAYEQLKQTLEQEGLFEAARKKALPPFVKKIGVITSATGAVLRDIYTVTKRRNPLIQLCLYPVQVQGAEAPAQIVHAIEVFNRKYPVDVLIVGRGGGSIEDLWAFNDERVVRAVFASQIPVVSAVGHETDYTLVDFVSDQRAATPSQAAEIVVFDRRETMRRIQSMKNALELLAKRQLQQKSARLQLCVKSKAYREPESLLLQKRLLADRISQRFLQVSQNAMQKKQDRLRRAMEKLSILNPLSTLNRGYTMVKRQGKLVSSCEALEVGELVALQFADGTAEAKVMKIAYERRGE